MPLSWNEIRDRATAFARDWAAAADERSDAQTFWNEFFEVFGVKRRQVATFEKHVDKFGDRAGFIDCFWPGTLIAEHKSRDRNLDSAFAQAIDYTAYLQKRDLPRYIVVSDFARIRLHDLEAGEAHEFALAELPREIQRFGFIAGYTPQILRAENPVNVDAAERMGRLHDALAAGYDGHKLEMLLVRLLFCLFAEDTGIFQPAQAFRLWLEDWTAEDGSDLGAQLAHAFQILNTPHPARSANLNESLAAFPYVNGRLFEEPLPIADFDKTMRDALLDACALDWGRISPAVFGAMFQSIMDADARRHLGAHYTSEQNIEKLIKPLFLDDLRAEFERVKNNRNKLFEFHKKLRTLTFLDPACGCGNFLVVTYRALRELELDVLRASAKGSGQLSLDVHSFINLDVDQFFGIEIEEFPARIAEVALWLTDHQMNVKVGEEFGLYFARIPLRATPHIHNANALRMDWEGVVPRERLSYVLGNPPFLGHHLQSNEQKADMTACYRYNRKPGVMDFVTAWYCLTADLINGTSIRAAFVSTNSIAQGEQVGMLWRELSQRAEIHISFAHRTFKWRNEGRGVAAVYCVIIGFSSQTPERPRLFEYQTVTGAPQERSANEINAYLVDAPWVLIDNSGTNRFGMPEMKYGSKPTDGGHFFMTEPERKGILESEPGSDQFIKPFVGAREYLNGLPRWTIWLADKNPAKIQRHPEIMKRVQAVDTFLKQSKAKTTREYPYPVLYRQVTQPQSDYILIPRHTSENRKYVPFGFFSKETIVGDSCFALPDATAFHYGVIQSAMHMAWMRYTCGRLKSDFRYSKDIVYNNFPWPQNVSANKRQTVEAAAQGVLDARAEFPDATLAELYDPLTMPPALLTAHRQLDRAVDSAYSRRKFTGDADRVAFLFEQYARLTEPA